MNIFKKKTAAEVKKAWKEVESHERELEKHQEMYRSILSEYYSALEVKKAMGIQNINAESDIYQSPHISELHNQTLHVKNLNIGSINIKKSLKMRSSNKKMSMLFSYFFNNVFLFQNYSKS